MLTEVQICKLKLRETPWTSILLRAFTYIMSGKKEYFRYKITHSEIKRLGSACADDPINM